MLTALIPLVALALASCAQGTGSGVATVEETVEVAAQASRVDVPADHPSLSEQEQLIACADCHRDTTPDVYDSWYASTHGIGNVKCYQCHGTYEDMKVAPAVSNCATCHADMITKQADAPACWTCHPAHTFDPHAE